MDAAELPARISSAALERRCDACVQALEMFVAVEALTMNDFDGAQGSHCVFRQPHVAIASTADAEEQFVVGNRRKRVLRFRRGPSWGGRFGEALLSRSGDRGARPAFRCLALVHCIPTVTTGEYKRHAPF